MTTKSYLVGAHSNQEGYNSDCDYCVVDFTLELLVKLAAWRKAFRAVKKRLPDVEVWQIGCTDATFISRKAAEALLGTIAFERVENDEDQLPVVIRSGTDVDLGKFDVTVADEVFMGPEGFWFEATPRHTDGLTVSSDYFAWKWFTECSNCGEQRATHTGGKCLFAPTKYASTAPRLDG